MGREIRKDSNGFWAVHETVSEAEERVTPAFKNRKDIADYLHKYGDFWMQKGKEGGLSKEVAEKFVRIGFVPSGMASSAGFLKTYQCVSCMED